MLAEHIAEPPVETVLAQHNAKDLLRMITCGNVDDGKSTLIGRLLLESGAVYDDQIEALQRDSDRHGTTGDQVDPALLLDGLEDERQQGITIDVAYRYFTTATRKFIIADTPGHEQFTRNMATGASTADLAVILIDASKGVTTQTRRHAYIVSLLGIKQLVLAVNKMDLVDYSQQTFDAIVTKFDCFSAQLSVNAVHAIPLSALNGENVVDASARMPWYDGKPLLELLNTVPASDSSASRELRFPVQWVNRPDPGFRGFSGTIGSGSLSVGDPVLVLPSKTPSSIRSIVTMDGELDQAQAGDAVTVTLADEIDVTRGDMIVHPHSQPKVGRCAEANLVWMSSQSLVPGKQYWFKQAARRTTCEVESIRYGVDVVELRRKNCASLGLNETGRCQLKLHDPVVHDAYETNRATGSFILVDKVTHETVAAGMLADDSGDPGTSGHWNRQSNLMPSPPAENLVTPQHRRQRYGHPPKTILITGLSSSGKTSVANALEKQLFDAGLATVMLDGQTLRSGINRDVGFSAEERSENLRRASEIAKLLNEAGLICIAAFVAPSDWVRQKARELIGEDRFFHAHLSTPVDVCRRRDITGQYVAADKGDIVNFPGVTFDYEQPTDADLIVDTQNLTPDEVADLIVKQLQIQEP